MSLPAEVIRSEIKRLKGHIEQYKKDKKEIEVKIADSEQSILTFQFHCPHEWITDKKIETVKKCSICESVINVIP